MLTLSNIAKIQVKEEKERSMYEILGKLHKKRDRERETDIL